MTKRTQSENEPKIDAELVKHVAFLVRLGISEEEAQTFSRQFTSILDYFHLLNEVDTSDVTSAATTHAENTLREDEVTPSMSREDFLKNAPRREGGFVKVPLVLGDD
ncbi:MAG TPA: Asp-tRNA(Asn)/Glu-tRNA(Gln) amidotransferase subunit GatC [Anaerolineales bacterium]|jgi:aspartyl-tRNA(Asn)/glutamyl-tRNA(Gln) amidotransferase subunit C